MPQRTIFGVFVYKNHKSTRKGLQRGFEVEILAIAPVTRGKRRTEAAGAAEVGRTLTGVELVRAQGKRT